MSDSESDTDSAATEVEPPQTPSVYVDDDEAPEAPESESDYETKNKPKRSKGKNKRKSTPNLDATSSKKSRRVSSVKITKNGTPATMTPWSEEQCKQLVKAVAKLGGKVPNWYTTISQMPEFTDRTPHSINSQYNQMLRKMSPLIDADTLAKEAHRRENLTPRIHKPKEKKGKVDRGKKKQVQKEEPEPNYTYQLVPEVKTEADRLLLNKPISYQDKCRKVFWGKSNAEPFWPGIVIPPNNRFEDPKITSMALECLKESHPNYIFYWFSDGRYSKLKEEQLFPWTPENIEKYTNFDKRVSGDQQHRRGSFKRTVSKQDAVSVLNAAVIAESFIRGRTHDPETAEIFSACGYQTLEANNLYPVSFKDLAHHSEVTLRKHMEEYKNQLINYLHAVQQPKVSEKISENVVHLLKELFIATPTKELLIESRLATLVANLMFDKNESVSSFAESLMMHWNKKYDLVGCE